MNQEVCSCGKGYCSKYDSKCANCRTKKEQKNLDLTLNSNKPKSLEEIQKELYLRKYNNLYSLYNLKTEKSKMSTKNENVRIQLKNVRLSFPSIFNRSVFEGVEGKYEATFLIPKEDTKTYKAVNKAIEDAIAKAKVKVPSDKRCLKDGDESEYEGYAGHWSLKAGNSKRPTVINRDKSPITQDDEVIYAGCYVNAVIDVWVQNNKYGKRVNSNLYGIQFVRDGEPFGMGPIDVTDDFDDLEDEI